MSGRRSTVAAKIIFLTSICAALFIPVAQVQCDKYDQDGWLHFYWSPASGNVDHYRVFLRNMTDDVIYPQVGENEEHPPQWTTPTAPTEQDPFPVPIEAEFGKEYRLQVQAVAADGITTGPLSEWSEPVMVAKQQILSLHKGWNLISIYLEIIDADLSSVLASIEGEGECRSVWTYEYDAYDDFWIWRRYIPGDPLNELHTIEAGKGYWINMTGDATLTIMGGPISQAYTNLYTGWNLVGYSASTPQPAKDGLPFTDANYTSIWTYNNMTESWLRYTIDAPGFLNNLNQLEPGSGYWIYVE